MATSNDGEISKTKSSSRPRKLPQIPTDQEPYDITKPPKKPPRLHSRPRRSSSPDFRRPKSSMREKSNSLTEAQLSSLQLGEDTKNSGSAGRQTLTINSSDNTPSLRHFSSDVIFNRRCGYCCHRIFPESEECLVAQFQVFHATCFRCAICNAGLDITNYCYLMHHGKFYCFQHCREVSEAEEGLGNEERDISETGPGAFGGSITTSVVYDKRRQNQMLKKLIEFQHRRAKLEKVAMQLQETITTAARDDKLLLGKHLCDVSYEKTMVMRGVTELAYQLKEGELCEEQEQLQRKLRRLKKRRDEGTRDENNEQEEKFLRCIFDVIEKRDLLLVELEIERRRDNAEVQKLKLQLEQADTENASRELHNVEQANGQCLIL